MNLTGLTPVLLNDRFAEMLFFCLASLWGQKILLFVFYRGLIRKLKWERATLWIFWTTFALSYIAVVLATFLECRPLSRFWFVFELDHENLCGRGAIQLYVQGELARRFSSPYPIQYNSTKTSRWLEHCNRYHAHRPTTPCVIPGAASSSAVGNLDSGVGYSKVVT